MPGKRVSERVYLDECLESLALHYAKTDVRVVEFLPPVTKFTTKCFVGAHSIHSVVDNVRYVLAAVAYKRDGYPPVTPADLAKSYLKLKFPDGRRGVSSQQIEAINAVRRRMPLYALPGQYENMVYADIKSAWFSIANISGWDISYNPYKYISQGHAMNDFPFKSNKLARSMLVTIGLSKRISYWDGKRMCTQFARSKQQNNLLYSFIADVLNCIAVEAVAKLRPKYIFTDGYIIPSEDYQGLREIVKSYGLQLSIKHAGDAHVKGTASYKVGKHQSMPYKSSRGSYANSIMPLNPVWYREAMTWMMERRVSRGEHVVIT